MTQSVLFEALERTWPPARIVTQNGIVVRLGAGGGKRVSSTYFADDTPDLIPEALELIAKHKAEHLFQIPETQTKIDTKLTEMGFEITDPTLLFTITLRQAECAATSVTAFPTWPPLQITRDIWAQGGINADRAAVMERVTLDKTSLLGRIENRAAGAAFVAIYDGLAMLHALEVAPKFRRRGLARHLTHAAMDWARDRGAVNFGLAVTKSNTAACGLYAALGMTIADRYHYRIKL